MKWEHSSKYEQFLPPQAFLAHPSYGTRRRLTWHCTTCYACLFQTIRQTCGAKEKLQFAGGVLFDLNCSFLCSHCLQCQENQHVDQWNFNNMHLFVMGIVTQLLYWSGHSGTQSSHQILYLNIPSLQKSLYTEVYFKIKSHTILHMDHTARRKAVLQLILLYFTVCQGPCSLVQCTEVIRGFVMVIKMMMISMTIMIVAIVWQNLGLRENCWHVSTFLCPYMLALTYHHHRCLTNSITCKTTAIQALLLLRYAVILFCCCWCWCCCCCCHHSLKLCC